MTCAGQRFGNNEMHTNEKNGKVFSFRKARYGVVKIKMVQKRISWAADGAAEQQHSSNVSTEAAEDVGCTSKKKQIQ